MLDKDDYMIIGAFIFVLLLSTILGIISVNIVSKVNKPVYPMDNMRCLIVADSITTIEQTCTVLGENK